MIYGVKSAFEEFQEIIEEILLSFKKTKNTRDDVIIRATNQGNLDSRLDKVLDIIKKMGLKMDPKKCIFSVSTLIQYWQVHKISANEY